MRWMSGEYAFWQRKAKQRRAAESNDCFTPDRVWIGEVFDLSGSKQSNNGTQH